MTTTINSTNEKMLPSKYTFEIGNAVAKYLYHLFKRKKSFFTNSSYMIQFALSFVIHL